MPGSGRIIPRSQRDCPKMNRCVLRVLRPVDAPNGDTKAEVSPSRPARILVVDDDPDFCLMLETSLS